MRADARRHRRLLHYTTYLQKFMVNTSKIDINAVSW